MDTWWVFFFISGAALVAAILIALALNDRSLDNNEN